MPRYGNMTYDPSYQALVDDLATKCTCTPNSDRPCAGLLAGGLCDDLHMGREITDEDDDTERDDLCKMGAAPIRKSNQPTSTQRAGSAAAQITPDKPMPKKLTKTRTRRLLKPVGSAIHWVIVGNCGLYEGQWQTRRAAIEAHTGDVGRDWSFCRRQGDRAVKALIQWLNAGTQQRRENP